MEIQQFITDSAKGPIALATLTTIAADRRAFGDDVAAAFTTQIQLRASQAQTVLDTATAANRDTLLASEQRGYDTNIRERDAILSLLHSVERRSESRAFVPASQVIAPETSTELAVVLGKEQRCADWVKAKGGRYVGERGAESARFGRVIRALATGDKRGLSDLELRALAEGSDTTGGFMVPEILSGTFIDAVRAQAVCFRAGAQTVPMTSDTLHLARLAQPGVVTLGSPPDLAAMPLAWKVENAPILEGDLTLERVTFTARTLALLVKASVELSEDAVNLDAVIERELSRAAALEVDRVALVGSGTPPEPAGILNQSGVDVASGASATYDDLIDAAAAVAANNHQPNARIYNSDFAATLAKLRNTPTGDYLRPPAYLEPITPFISNQAALSGTPSSPLFFVGDFSSLMIGMRTSFRLEVSRTAGDAFGNLQIWTRMYLRADIQLSHAEAFAVRT